MTTKIAVSLPDELVADARAAVTHGRAESVSAYVAAAMAEQSRRVGLAALLADWADEVGPVSADDLAWADEALGPLPD